MKPCDKDIRQALHSHLETFFRDDPDTIIVDELDICYGCARIDVAVINGALHGYEIKSERDNLERLPNQVEQYNQVFDFVTLVCGEKFLDRIHNTIPSWWGVYCVKEGISGIEVESIKEPQKNTTLDPFALAQFLWRNEMMEILPKYTEDKIIKKSPKYKLWRFLSENMDIEELQEYVKTCLKTRTDWRVGSLHRLSDG
jgi:hypothetical protein